MTLQINKKKKKLTISERCGKRAHNQQREAQTSDLWRSADMVMQPQNVDGASNSLGREMVGLQDTQW